jgi:hypothetical protein
MIAMASPDHFLLIRQAIDADADGPDPTTAGARGKQDRHADTPPADPQTVKLPPGTGFTYCHVPEKSPIAATLPNLVLMVGRRWPVEEAIAVGKGPIGWDQNQFRKYKSVQRHAALCGLAMLRANMLGEPATPRFADERCPQDVGCIRLSMAETHRLVNLTKSHMFAVTTEFLLRWSMWRRRHQAVARWHHRRARLTAAATSP